MGPNKHASTAELCPVGRANPELVALAKKLHRRNPKTGERKSLRAIAAELARLGHINVNGQPFAAESIKAMVRS